MTKQGLPHPTAASCQVATTTEVANGPFGQSTQPQFSCSLTVNRTRARYDVQIQGNGCYVAERHKRGQAIYGCGVRGNG